MISIEIYDPAMCCSTGICGLTKIGGNEEHGEEIPCTT
ncbi:arsenic metallochaperone ArsD family protein [Paenibacillus sp. NPDC093718]